MRGWLVFSLFAFGVLALIASLVIPIEAGAIGIGILRGSGVASLAYVVRLFYLAVIDNKPQASKENEG